MATIEKEFMGRKDSKMWTYLILLFLLIVGGILVNLWVKNPELAKNGFHRIFGMPSWGLALLAFVVGSGIFWLGLKMETDWPEAIGAFMIAGSVWAGEILIGWNHFTFGLFIIPYAIPVLTFIILLMVGMRKSV